MKKTVSVAPMMDCTDKHEIYFLSLISKNIHLYTEMIVANAIIRGDKTKLLSFKKINNPVTLQVGGSNPNELAEACKISEDYGYKEINLNLGCPSKKVQKNKFGACLMQEPDLVAKCIEAMAKASKLPVTIKTRIGYNDVENFEFLKSFIQTTKDAGSKKFIIHARKALLKKLTPKENLNIPPLKYDFVYKLKDYFKDDEIIINEGYQVKYVAPKSGIYDELSPSKSVPNKKVSWIEPDYDDSKWNNGISGVGHSEGDDNTVLRDTSVISIYSRYNFDLTDPNKIKKVS